MNALIEKPDSLPAVRITGFADHLSVSANCPPSIALCEGDLMTITQTASGKDSEFSHEVTGFWIARINVPARYRGKGLGSKLLDTFLQRMDATNNTTIVGINPNGGLDYNALRAWYERRGFVEDKKLKLLVRPPRTPTVIESLDDSDY